MSDEIRRLRTALRDLVALSTVPAAWVGREPAAIAAGLADIAVGMLDLDFAFVRLRNPINGTTVDVTRGTAWKQFPDWLAQHLATGGPAPNEVVHDVGGDATASRGLVVHIGVEGEAGLVAVASHRRDFPSETDQLLLSVAANHAATACHGARLIHERRRAEVALLHTRDELELKVMERTSELRRTSAELHTIFEASPLGKLLLNRANRVQRCNSAFERLLGWTAVEIVGLNGLLPAPIQELSRLCARHVAGTKGFSGLEARIGRKDGSEFDAAVSCTPLVDEGGEPAGMVVNIEDVTDRVRAAEALRKAQAELTHVTRLSTLGELAASIAHETNQPLAAIVADAEALLIFLGNPDANVEQIREVLCQMVTESHRAAAVIRRIRQLATKTDPEKVPLHINEVICDAAVLVRGELQKHRASLALALSPALPSTLGDRVQLQQVIINLLMNGVEAMTAVNAAQRALVVRSELGEADRVLVAVQDAGVGLDPRYTNQLYDPFFTTKPSGMGMGLSISRSIIEGHGGRIWATANPIHGATFQFTLPVSR
jgi:PAS domain S-box-containing protein